MHNCTFHLPVDITRLNDINRNRYEHRSTTQLTCVEFDDGLGLVRVWVGNVRQLRLLIDRVVNLNIKEGFRERHEEYL